MIVRIDIPEQQLKNVRRWTHQSDRCDRIWSSIRKGHGDNKGERMSRVLDIQRRVRTRTAIVMEVAVKYGVSNG